MDSETEIAAELIRSCAYGALGTLDGDGLPFVSFVSVATHGARPVLLLSRLAQHSAHLTRRREASLLFGPKTTGDDPLTGARVTVTGTVAKSGDPAARAAFLACHPSASRYADFSDFSIYLMSIEKAHLVAGFGRIASVEASAISAALQGE